jgi:hypothetical protein
MEENSEKLTMVSIDKEQTILKRILVQAPLAEQLPLFMKEYDTVESRVGFFPC